MITPQPLLKDVNVHTHPIIIGNLIGEQDKKGILAAQGNGQMLLGVSKMQKQTRQQSKPQRFSRREMGLGLVGATGLIVGGGDIIWRLCQQGSTFMNLPKEPHNLDFVKGTTGWFLTGSHPQDYDFGSDRDGVTPQSASAYLKSRTAQAEGFGTFMQAFKGSEFLGKRLRFSAYVKAQDIEQWAGLWMRMDGSWQKGLSFDNMQSRPIRGTVDWQKYEVVLDVPQQTAGIYFGVLLAGSGHIWLSNVQLETVSEQVPTTA